MKKTFLFGCNYWASNGGCQMWKDFDERTVEKDFALLEGKAKAFYAHKGHLAESAATLKSAIEASDEFDRLAEKYKLWLK